MGCVIFLASYFGCRRCQPNCTCRRNPLGPSRSMRCSRWCARAMRWPISPAACRRLAAVQMMELGLARQDELSAALQVDRSTLYRQSRKVKVEGVLGVVDSKRGPQGPHRFTVEKRERAQRLLAQGMSMRQAAEQVGVSEGTIRHALRRGDRSEAKASAVAGPSERSRRDACCAGGVAVHRHSERALARMGKLSEAAPRFVAA